MPIIILVFGLSLLVSSIASYVLKNKKLNRELSAAQREAERIEADNENTVNHTVAEIEAQTQQELAEFQAEAEQEIEEQDAENQARGQRLDFREKSLDSSAARLERFHQTIKKQQGDLTATQTKIDETKKQARDLVAQRAAVVYEKSGLTPEQTRQLVIQNTETKLKQDYDVTVRENHDDMVWNAKKEANNLMIKALECGVQDVPRDHIDRNIIIPDEAIRNKITGRAEQWLRLVESLAGVDLIFHPEYPEVLIINTNDPIRREITRETINELVASRQINAAVIENIVNEVQRRVMDNLRIFGEETCNQLRLGWVHPDLMKLIGRLKYRTSYSQNVLQHSVEVAELCGAMALELGLNVRQAKRAGLLHDIGKAIDREVNGTHVELGVRITEAFEESDVIINSIAASHGDTETDNLIAVLVKVADSMSGARPGARSESVEEYINRLKGLERIANSHEGVKDSYAIQAGREVRIIVDPRMVTTEQGEAITRDVCDQIEAELTYPGKIKVTTIRKLNVVQYVGGKPNLKKKKHAS
ncbi:ribonuclease Y [Fructilactobacillus vespulae]|uniref:ribonuclease Y n=1 Tax=Fructilactobacillus vespulae TaxID=1249630 RepID=UPI0039B5680B